MKKELYPIFIYLSMLILTGFAYSSQEYVVERGDTLWDISKKTNLSIEQLKNWNHLTSTTIYPNQRLKLSNDEQTATTYNVKQGDTLSAIAVKFGVTVEQLMSWNGLENEFIFAGDKLAVHSSSRKNKNENSNEIELDVTATAYTAYCSGCSGTTATGINLREHPKQKVIAVDPNVIPLGSRVWVDGYGEAIAADTGSAIKGHKIDVFIPTEKDAIDWGVRKVKMKVLS